MYIYANIAHQNEKAGPHLNRAWILPSSSISYYHLLFSVFLARSVTLSFFAELKSFAIFDIPLPFLLLFIPSLAIAKRHLDNEEHPRPVSGCR